MAIWLVGAGLIIGWLISYPLPDYFTRLIDPQVIKAGSAAGPQICLTFDDGPDREYTPQILQILKEYQIPAVFFLVGRKAEQNPELVSTILSQGHELGIHSYDHHHAYRMFISNSIATIKKGREVLEKLASGPVSFFRPPWGALNLFQYCYLKRSGLNIVLWTANAQDWNCTTGSSGIIKRLLRRVKSNSIIVLHDSGGEPLAPANTVAALPEFIRQMRSNGYQFVSLADLTRRASDGRH